MCYKAQLISSNNKKNIKAWYINEIPVKYRPTVFHGLLGLILEIPSDKSIIVCAEIKLTKNKKLKEFKYPNSKILNSIQV